MSKQRPAAVKIPRAEEIQPTLSAPLPSLTGGLEGNECSSVRRRYNVALVSDFFFPRVGGVEKHIYMLAQCLILRHHKVIVLTHGYKKRRGVRYLANGLKVYYCPLVPFYDDSTVPMPWTYSLLLRNILDREQIDLVHTHQKREDEMQSSSFLALLTLSHARTLGFRTVFTDHSLFGFDDAVCIHLNKVCGRDGEERQSFEVQLLKFSLSDADSVICVSHTSGWNVNCSKENVVLRAALNPLEVYVIPNAVDSALFTPDPSASANAEAGTITVVVISRLVYRKGVDLVVQVIPRICEMFPNVNFIIGGDGNKRLDLEEMIEANQLHDRVEMLGAVPSDRVRDVMVRGHVFLNCSLTEAFCMALLEAACCGLYVVSTEVGGVSEVLPDHMISYAKPNPDHIVQVLAEILPSARSRNAAAFHKELRLAYDWKDVAARTERVYDHVLERPPLTFIERLIRLFGCGAWAGKLFCAVIALDFLVCFVLNWIWPRSQTERAVDFPSYPFDFETNVTGVGKRRPSKSKDG